MSKWESTLPALLLVGSLCFTIKVTNFIIMQNDCVVLMAAK